MFPRPATPRPVTQTRPSKIIRTGNGISARGRMIDRDGPLTPWAQSDNTRRARAASRLRNSMCNPHAPATHEKCFGNARVAPLIFQNKWYRYGCTPYPGTRVLLNLESTGTRVPWYSGTRELLPEYSRIKEIIRHPAAWIVAEHQFLLKLREE